MCQKVENVKTAEREREIEKKIINRNILTY